MNQVQNSVTLIGNLGKDPVKKGSKQNTVTSFSLATNESYNNKDGEKITLTQWHRCVAFGKKADILVQYAKKGSKLAVQGKIKYDRYTDKDGIDRLSMDIIINDFIMLDQKPEKKAA
ncbi:single-stranded DNA-binding protein [Lewinella cohaerens]|uniref:single-stranded DNA-binding protein n=1 Tax=Lewinella cohaerens TaxID=70995 RepID=UPI00037D5CAA|nr:single-stranded DNA-binding protein [Lewinella cohaerens]